jgi:hypothetical protein
MGLNPTLGPNLEYIVKAPALADGLLERFSTPQVDSLWHRQKWVRISTGVHRSDRSPVVASAGLLLCQCIKTITSGR